MKDGERKASARKKGKGQEHIVKLIKSVSTVLVILILLFIMADKFGNITFSSVGDYISSAVSGTKRGDGYPYLFDSLQVKDVKAIGSDLILINDSSTVVLDSTARKVSEIQHTYSSPLCYGNSGRVLLADIGGNTFKIMSKTKTLYEGTTDKKIISAAIGKNGTAAIATRGTNSQSDLTVYNKNQRVIFSWKCAKENIVAIDISDNGKLAAVSVVGAENGELYSRVLIFDFSYEEAVSEFDFGSDIISGVNFLKGDTLLITGENVFSIVKNKTDKQDEDLSLNSLSRISVSDNNVVAAVLSKYGSSSAKILNVYNRNGEKLFTVDITSAVKSVSCDNQRVSVLTDSE
ncbi:hypothetical protein LEA_13938, partial [human gut metagenome]